MYHLCATLNLTKQFSEEYWEVTMDQNGKNTVNWVQTKNDDANLFFTEESIIFGGESNNQKCIHQMPHRDFAHEGEDNTGVWDSNGGLLPGTLFLPLGKDEQEND
jgi:hypothetical protein